MQYSKYNIFSKIKGSDNYFVVNLLHRNADILNPSEAEELANIKKDGVRETLHLSEFIDKGYVVDENDEKVKYKNAYLDFNDSKDSDEVQLFFVPNYSCNFACTYCYQDDYKTVKSEVTHEVIDSFFEYI